jgi:hypothetical protein
VVFDALLSVSKIPGRGALAGAPGLSVGIGYPRDARLRGGSSKFRSRASSQFSTAARR